MSTSPNTLPDGFTIETRTAKLTPLEFSLACLVIDPALGLTCNDLTCGIYVFLLCGEHVLDKAQDAYWLVASFHRHANSDTSRIKQHKVFDFLSKQFNITFNL